MTFPIKERINIDLFIDIHKVETRIIIVTNEGDQPVTLTGWRI